VLSKHSEQSAMADHAAPCGYRRYVASLAPIDESSKLSIREGYDGLYMEDALKPRTLFNFGRAQAVGNVACCGPV